MGNGTPPPTHVTAEDHLNQAADDVSFQRQSGLVLSFVESDPFRALERDQVQVPLVDDWNGRS
jgi:hypothetical protein